MPTSSSNARERRLRRSAIEQGLRLEKSRRRDPMAPDFGGYWLIDGPAPTAEGDNWRSRTVVVGGDHGADLDAIEAALA